VTVVPCCWLHTELCCCKADADLVRALAAPGTTLIQVNGADLPPASV
jgi:hypothetical protein